MTTQQKDRLLKALEKIAAACQELHELETRLSNKDRNAWNYEAHHHLAVEFSRAAANGCTVGWFLNPKPDYWEMGNL